MWGGRTRWSREVELTGMGEEEEPTLGGRRARRHGGEAPRWRLDDSDMDDTTWAGNGARVGETEWYGIKQFASLVACFESVTN